MWSNRNIAVQRVSVLGTLCTAIHYPASTVESRKERREALTPHVALNFFRYISNVGGGEYSPA